MKRDIEFLFEIGRLRFLQRTWQRFFVTKVANDTEHTFRVMWIALIIAKKEGVRDEGRLLKMALVHDIAENRTGDVDYLSRLYAKRDEEMAINDMLDETSLKDEFLDLWREVEKKETKEAQIIKDADTLDIDLELMEQRDANEGLVSRKIEMRKKQVRPKIFTETAREMFDEVYESDVHSWHFDSKNNRFNSGDWVNKDEK